MIFGKSYSEYIRYQWPFLVGAAVLGFTRLGLSLAGQPNDVTRYFSMTVLLFIGIFYYALTLRRRGFGTYKHMLPMVFNQLMIAHIVAVIGIALSASGYENVFNAPEFRGPVENPADVTPTQHILAHLLFGSWMGALVGWLVGCIVMAIGGGRPRTQP